MFKREVLIENAHTHDKFGTPSDFKTARLIIMDMDDGGCKQIVDIFEMQIDDEKDANRLAAWYDWDDFFEYSIMNAEEYDFGKARKFQSKVARAIWQKVNEEVKTYDF